MSKPCRYNEGMTATHTDTDTDTILFSGEMTNDCTCTVYDEEAEEYTDEPAPHCYGCCWEMAVEDFANVTEDLRNANPDGWWAVDDLRLWNRTVSGYFQATNVTDIIRGMTVDSSWIMRYRVYADRVEYSLSHHDAMGSASTLRPMRDEEPF